MLNCAPSYLIFVNCCVGGRGGGGYGGGGYGGDRGGGGGYGGGGYGGKILLVKTSIVRLHRFLK